MKIREIIQETLATLEKYQNRTKDKTILNTEYCLLSTLYWNNHKLKQNQIVLIYEYLIEYILKLFHKEELNQTLREKLKMENLLKLLSELESIEE